MMRRLAVICCLGACAEPPAEGEQPLTVEIIPVDPEPRADGVGRAEIRVRWDAATEAFARDVVVTVSDGVLGTGAQDDARQVSGKATRAGVMVVPLTFGRTPGAIRVAAQAGEFAPVFAAIDLAARAPDEVALAADPGRVAGGDALTVTVELLMDDPVARPSIGTRIWLRGCCAHDGAPLACAGEAPLRVPTTLTLGADDEALQATVVARAVDAPTSGFIVASRTPDPPCSDGADAAVGIEIE